MSEKLTVYSQLIESPDACMKSIKREIGMNVKCVPFAVKVIEALKTLKIRTEQDALKAANTLMSGLQTLWQGGILAEDYDKIDFVNRSNTIVPSARVEAFLRAAARKGYRITDTIVAVPKADADTTYFKENFYNGDIVYTLEDARKQPDRAVTAERIIDEYFSKFICRLDVHDVQKNQRVAMSICEMSTAEILAVASASEQGIYKSKWEEYQAPYGTKKRKVITNELNKNGFWYKWTGEMVNKTIIRRALKRIREVLPELKEAIFAFEQEDVVAQDDLEVVENEITIPMKENVQNVDLEHLTEEQKEDCTETYDMFVANPKLAEDKLSEIKARFERGDSKQDIINDEYAAIIVLQRSKSKGPELRGYFENEENKA